MTTITMTTTTASSEKKRRRRVPRKHTVAEPGSLYDTLHDHDGLSLFVLPLCWTGTQPRLLGCHFAQCPPRLTPTPALSSHSPWSIPQASKTVMSIGRDLDTLMTLTPSRSLVVKNRALKNIMSTLFPTTLYKPQTNAELDLRFGGRNYPRAVRCQVLWKHPDATKSFDSATTWTSSRPTSQLLASVSGHPSNDTPVLAYVSRSNLDNIRRHCFRVVEGPDKSFNGPVHRLQSLRSKSLIPADLDKEPYFVATMIAMAQNSIYADGEPKGNEFHPRDVKVRLLTAAEKEAAFIVYSATIPSAFLTMWHEPHKAPVGETKFKIEYTEVPIWPVLGLKERLGQALGRDVVGDFDELNMELFEDEELTSSAESVSPKRRRTALSEVLNASFSEDRDTGCDELMGKRRCLEEGRVGLVR